MFDEQTHIENKKLVFFKAICVHVWLLPGNGSILNGSSLDLNAKKSCVMLTFCKKKKKKKKKNSHITIF